MTDIDWSKAPEGATHYCLGNDLWYRPGPNGRAEFPNDNGCWVASGWKFAHLDRNPDIFIPRPEPEPDMTDIDWSKAPEGATHYGVLNRYWYRKGPDKYAQCMDPTDTGWRDSIASNKSLDKHPHAYSKRPEPKPMTQPQMKLVLVNLDDRDAHLYYWAPADAQFGDTVLAFAGDNLTLGKVIGGPPSHPVATAQPIYALVKGYFYRDATARLKRVQQLQEQLHQELQALGQ